jgi:hypothetical protein
MIWILHSFNVIIYCQLLPKNYTLGASLSVYTVKKFGGHHDGIANTNVGILKTLNSEKTVSKNRNSRPTTEMIGRCRLVVYTSTEQVAVKLAQCTQGLCREKASAHV